MVNFWPRSDLTIQPLLLVNNGVYLTTGNPIVAECRPLCRVPKVEHSATGNIPSVIQKTLGKILTLGKFAFCRVLDRKHTVKLAFAECRVCGTRQRQHVPAMWSNAITEVVFAECLNSALGKCIPLPSVRFKALGIVRFCRVSESRHSAN